MKNILITTVSAYRSWNSGVAWRNSSPGCVSNRYLNNALKSSGTIYLSLCYAIILNVLLATDSFSNSSFQKFINVYLPIASDLMSIYWFFLMYSNKFFLNILGHLQTSTITGSNSSSLRTPAIAPPLNDFSIAASLSYFYYLVS